VKTTDIFNEQKIYSLLQETKAWSPKIVENILKKASKKKGITVKEAGYLLHVKDPELLVKIQKVANEIKNDIYGERLVFFAPLYLASYCVNDCEYCGFHARNHEKRKKLSLDEVEQQTKELIKMGHKRLLLEFGEHPSITIGYVVDCIKRIYSTKYKNGEIRRVNVNIAATTIEDYKKLGKVGIGTYQLFQETYHRETYEQMHPTGPKKDYHRQLFAHDRAFQAGLDDVGIGVLFGLYDYRFETLALILHANYLEKTYGTGPHTISVPRFQPAKTVTLKPDFFVSEEELLHIIAVLRIAVPYTGMIISTRERPEIRKKAFELGISQTSAASETTPGGYGRKETASLKQFQTADHRSLEEVMKSILKQGLLPSFCTACYREGRTGEDFMHIAKPGEIHNLCRPNALLTLQEYLEDYATEEVKEMGEKVVEKYLQKIQNKTRKNATIRRLQKIKEGKRDLYF
jgi:2-iminoacetate synthase